MRLSLGLLLVVVIIAVRLIALDADPPQWLSWSMGLQTDEGFYTLDARHEAAFGTSAPGNFHDRLLSPLLSILQQGIFQTFGTGTVAARLISVTFSLLTIIAFWYGLREAFDDRVAFWGALLLGLVPPIVFYNRMALQETPTVFWLVLSFALWTHGEHVTRHRHACFVASGVCLGLAIVFKAIAIIGLPAFLLAWRKESFRAAVLGLGCSLGLYLVLWYLPHHAELGRMGTYYRMHQFEPHSLRSVWLNIRRGSVDGERGLFPYLLRLMPIPCLLALMSLHKQSVKPEVLLRLWLLCGLAFCLLSSYAPDRYYVLFYPALAGLAALGASRLPERMQYLGVALFLITCGYWCGRTWSARDYARRDGSQRLTQTLPRGSVLAGEMAPALCLDTPFAAVPVQPGLSNDVRPIERLRVTHILVTRAPNQQRWWQAQAPAVIQSSHWLMTLPLHDRHHDLVDVYAVRKPGQ